MKKSLILSTVLLLGQMNQGEVQASEGQFAVLKPAAACEVKVPKGRKSSQVYFSNDCQTAYVLPSLSMKKTILEPTFVADSGICSRYNIVIDSLRDLELQKKEIKDLIAKLRVKLAAAEEYELQNSLSRRLESMKEALIDLTSDSNSALKPFYNTRALKTQVSVSSDIMEEVAAFQKENLEAPIVSSDNKIYATRFAPAQIASAVLAISSKDDVDVKGLSVLNIDFPGTRYVPSSLEKLDYPKDATLVNMNGSMSGIIDLSAVTFCNKVVDRNGIISTEDSNLLKVFNSAVAINLDYQVKVQAGVKLTMTSEFDAVNFLNKVKNSVTNTYYNRDTLHSVLIKGGLLQSLKIEIDDKGQDVDLAKLIFDENLNSTVENLSPVVPLINRFIAKHFEMIDAKLTSLGILATLTEEEFKEKENTVSTEVARYEQVCSTNRRWFSKSTFCSLQPVYVTVNHDGISKAQQNVKDSSKIQNTVVFETNQTTTVRHNSTFVLPKTK